MSSTLTINRPLKYILDKKSNNLSYEGWAIPGTLESSASWQIKRTVKINTQSITDWAGNGDFNQIWDDRETLFGSIPFGNENSLEFDGINDYLETPHSTDLNFERTNAFSISHWIKIDNITATHFWLSKRENAGNVRGWQTFYFANSGPALSLSNINVGNRLFVYGPALPINTWYHIIFTYDGSSSASGVKMYLNGTSVSLVVQENTLTGTIQTNVPTNFGTRNGATGNFFSGKADEIAVWNIELNQSQVNDIYNSGVVRDLSTLSTGANLISWWRMGDNDTYPTILDQIGSNDFTMLNMTNSDINTDIP